MNEKINNQIIEAFQFPLSLMAADVQAQSCGQDHRFQEDGAECAECLYVMECKCINENCTSSNLKEKPLEVQVKLLQLGWDYVNFHPSILGHHKETCECGACCWLREVGALLARSRQLVTASSSGAGDADRAVHDQS